MPRFFGSGGGAPAPAPKKTLIITNDFSSTSLARFSVFNSAGCSATSGSSWGLRLTTDSTANHQSSVQSNTASVNGGLYPVGGTVTLAAQVYYQPASGAGVTSGQAQVTAGAHDGIGFGFKWVTTAGPTHTLYATSHDGVTPVSIALSPAAAVFNNDLLLMAVKTPTAIKYYVNGVLLATSTTNIPADNPYDTQFYSAAVNSGAAGNPTIFNVGFISVEKDLEP